MAPIAVTNVAHARSLTRAHRVPFRYGDCHGNIASIGQQSSQPPRHGHGQAHEPIPSSHCRSPSLVAHYRSRFWRQDCVLSKTACEHQPTGCMRHAASLWYAKTPWPNSNSYCHRTPLLPILTSPIPLSFAFLFPSATSQSWPPRALPAATTPTRAQPSIPFQAQASAACTRHTAALRHFRCPTASSMK